MSEEILQKAIEGAFIYIYIYIYIYERERERERESEREREREREREGHGKIILDKLWFKFLSSNKIYL